MKRNIFNKKFIAGLGIISMLATVGLSGVNYNLTKAQTSFHQINSGVSVCFERVGQSFTALMIKDFSSNYLTKDFQSMTGECFNEVARSLSELTASKILLKNVNNLKSDLFWFDQKVNKIVDMVKSENINLSQSNIINKYDELYSMKSELESSISSEANSLNQNIFWSLGGVILGGFGFLFSLFAFGLSRKLENNELLEAADQLENSPSTDLASWEIKLGRLLEKAVDPRVKTMLMSAFSQKNEMILSLEAKLHRQAVMTGRYEVSLSGVNGSLNEFDEIDSKGSSIDFNFLMNMVIEKLNDKIQKKSLILNMDLSDDFQIVGVEEDLQQFMYTLLNYNINHFENSPGNSLKIKSKALGGIAYCQIAREGMAFTDTEIKVLTGKASQVVDAPMQLVLLKELLDETGASMSVKNKVSANGIVDGVMEVIFNRSEESVQIPEMTNSKSTTNVVKGNKAAIREFFDRQLEAN